MQPQCMEAQGALWIERAPDVEWDVLDHLQRDLLVLLIASPDDESRNALGLAAAHIGRLQHRTQHALGGLGLFANELSVSGEHAAEMLRPRRIARGVDDHVPGSLGA